MEAFGFCMRRLVSAVELLVHPSVVPAAEIIDLYCKISEHYERFDCRLTISAMLDVFHNHMTAYFTRLRQYIHGTYVELPP